MICLSADHARAIFADWFTYADLSEAKLHRLALYVAEECAKHSLSGAGVDMWLRARKFRTCKLHLNADGSIGAAFIRVDGTYFKNREAISFNSDGYIGFAGWASTANERPFLDAFGRWLGWMLGVSVDGAARLAC